MLTKNRIFLDRTQGVGILTKERAIALGCTGVMGRASGIPYDVRKDNPYLVYGDLDFEVPVGQDGDNWDRFMVPLRGGPPVAAHPRAVHREDAG